MPATNVTISAEYGDILIEPISDKTYTGKAIEPTSELLVSLGAGWDVLSPGTDYDVTYTNNINAGKAKVTVKLKGSRLGTATAEFTIKPAKATITVDNASKVEGQADPEFTGTVSGLVKNDDLGNIKYKRTNADEAPGTYKGVITADYTDNSNYDVTVKNGDFTIGAKGVYKAVEGAGGTYVQGSDDALSFTFKRAEDDQATFEHFTGVLVDGNVVQERDSSGKTNYKAKRGSVIIEFQPEFLKTLSGGKHTITALFDDSDGISVSFEVTGTAPKTGDGNVLFTWSTALLSSAILIVLVSERRRRTSR